MSGVLDRRYVSGSNHAQGTNVFLRLASFILWERLNGFSLCLKLVGYDKLLLKFDTNKGRFAQTLHAFLRTGYWVVNSQTTLLRVLTFVTSFAMINMRLYGESPATQLRLYCHRSQISKCQVLANAPELLRCGYIYQLVRCVFLLTW